MFILHACVCVLNPGLDAAVDTDDEEDVEIPTSLLERLPFGAFRRSMWFSLLVVFCITIPFWVIPTNRLTESANGTLTTVYQVNFRFHFGYKFVLDLLENVMRRLHGSGSYHHHFV
jgi:hypothetical protein